MIVAIANQEVVRIAMWSGPRNISTAMMRAWENRHDTAVVDEPFYACFLTASKKIHPMHDEVLASQKNNWGEVIAGALSAPLAENETIQYQKQMTHHMVGKIDLDWFKGLRHAFLIRHPADVLHSYNEKRESASEADLGFKRQRELYDLACSCTEHIVPIVDAKDVLTNPARLLRKLTETLGVPFTEHMLAWPAGKRVTDGVWADHWYNNVFESTGFMPWQQKRYTLPPEQNELVSECMPHYEYLYKRRLKI